MGKSPSTSVVAHQAAGVSPRLRFIRDSITLAYELPGSVPNTVMLPELATCVLWTPPRLEGDAVRVSLTDVSVRDERSQVRGTRPKEPGAFGEG